MQKDMGTHLVGVSYHIWEAATLCVRRTGIIAGGRDGPGALGLTRVLPA